MKICCLRILPFIFLLGLANCGGGGGSTTTTKTTPTITWATPAAITYGTALSATQLNATASVAGSFTYTPAAGTTPAAGLQTLSATFTPTDTADYTTATDSVTLMVNKATPTVTVWPTASAITYNQTLGSVILTGGTASVPGSFAFSTPTTAPSAGTASQSVTFIPSDAADYNAVMGSVSVTVNKATPAIDWTPPTTTDTGTPLANILTATSPNANGGFAYTATISGGSAIAITSASTLTTAGIYTITANFMPTDAANYTTAQANVQLTVTQAYRFSSRSVSPRFTATSHRANK
jgi:hypothetical protein